MGYRNLLRTVLFSIGLALSLVAGAQQNGTFKKVTVLDTVKLRGVAISHIVTDFSTQSHFNLPTSQAVWDLVAASAIDTIYISAGTGGDPDTICISGPLCAVLPPGISASEVADIVSDSLDWVRDTTQSLRAAINAVQDSLDNIPDGSGTTGQYALWQDGNSLVGSALSEGIDRLTVAAGRTFRITGMATGSFGAGSAGDFGYDSSVNWFNGHNGTSRWAFARAATSNGIFTPGAAMFAGTDGSIQQDAANLFYNDTDNTFNVGTTTYSGIYSRVNILGTGVGISTRTLALYKSNGVNYFSAYDNGRIGFGAYGGTSETTFTQASAELQVEFASSTGGLRIYNNSSRYFQGNNWYFGATNNGFGTTSPDRYLHAEISSSSTNTVLASFRTSAISTGTVTTGFGVRVIEGEAENASNTNRIITEVDAVYTTATNAAETSDLVTKVMNAGTLTERLRVDGDDGVIVTGELRVTDLDNDTPTHIAMADADGDMSAKTPGIGLALAADGTPYVDSTKIATQHDLAAGLAATNTLYTSSGSLTGSTTVTADASENITFGLSSTSDYTINKTAAAVSSTVLKLKSGGASASGAGGPALEFVYNLLNFADVQYGLIECIGNGSNSTMQFTPRNGSSVPGLIINGDATGGAGTTPRVGISDSYYLPNNDGNNGDVITSNGTGNSTWSAIPPANLTFTGASPPFTLNSSTGTDVTFASGAGIALSRSSNELTVATSQSFFNDYDAALSLTGIGATPDTLDTDSNTKSNDWLFSPSTNTYTYNGYNGRYYSVSLSAQMEDVSGNGETLTLAVYRNGSVTSAVAKGAHPSGGLEPITMHGQTILLLSIGDTINVKASSTSGSGDDFDITNYSLIIKEI